jgi:hypothetical protein
MSCHAHRGYALACGFSDQGTDTLFELSRLLKNKHQAVSQGARRFGKRSIFRICEHLQKPCNAGSRPEVKFFNSLIEPDHRLLPQGSKETRKTADASGERFSPDISEKFFRIGVRVIETGTNF